MIITPVLITLVFVFWIACVIFGIIYGRRMRGRLRNVPVFTGEDIGFDDALRSTSLNERMMPRNSPVRNFGETFFDAMMSEEANLRSTLKGQEMIQLMQTIGNKQYGQQN